MQTNNFKNNYNPNPSVFFPNCMNYSLCNQYPYNKYKENDERFGGFLVPFLAGAVVSAPFWYLGANNKYQQMYYQNQPYPMYYPYQSVNQQYPSYYPYPQYR